MTPFGKKIRELREQKQVSQAAMAKHLGVSPAYLSALEHGKKGKPSWGLVQSCIAYFDIIWEEAEDLQSLAKLSHPRAVIDTASLSPAATSLANKLAQDIGKLSEEKLDRITSIVDEKPIK